MAAVNTARLEQVLGPGWQTMGVRELCRRERQLETAAGFTHTLVRYIDDLGVSTAGQALAVLAERQENGNGAVAEPPRRAVTRVTTASVPDVNFHEVAEALGFELGTDAL